MRGAGVPRNQERAVIVGIIRPLIQAAQHARHYLFVRSQEFPAGYIGALFFCKDFQRRLIIPLRIDRQRQKSNFRAEMFAQLLANLLQLLRLHRASILTVGKNDVDQHHVMT